MAQNKGARRKQTSHTTKTIVTFDRTNSPDQQPGSSGNDPTVGSVSARCVRILFPCLSCQAANGNDEVSDSRPDLAPSPILSESHDRSVSIFPGSTGPRPSRAARRDPRTPRIGTTLRRHRRRRSGTNKSRHRRREQTVGIARRGLSPNLRARQHGRTAGADRLRGCENIDSTNKFKIE